MKRLPLFYLYTRVGTVDCRGILIVGEKSRTSHLRLVIGNCAFRCRASRDRLSQSSVLGDLGVAHFRSSLPSCRSRRKSSFSDSVLCRSGEVGLGFLLSSLGRWATLTFSVGSHGRLGRALSDTYSCLGAVSGRTTRTNRQLCSWVTLGSTPVRCALVALTMLGHADLLQPLFLSVTLKGIALCLGIILAVAIVAQPLAASV